MKLLSALCFLHTDRLKQIFWNSQCGYIDFCPKLRGQKIDSEGQCGRAGFYHHILLAFLGILILSPSY